MREKFWNPSCKVRLIFLIHRHQFIMGRCSVSSYSRSLRAVRGDEIDDTRLERGRGGASKRHRSRSTVDKPALSHAHADADAGGWMHDPFPESDLGEYFNTRDG